MGRTRAIAYGVVALLGVAAVLFTNPLPRRENTPAGTLLAEQQAHLWRERHDTVRRNESLASVLARGGVSDVIVRAALKAAKTLDPRRIPIGMPLVIRTREEDSVPTEIVLKLAVDKLLHITRTDSVWAVAEEDLPWRVDTIAVSGVVRTNLYEAMDSSTARELLGPGARSELTGNLADIFEYRVDMSRDLQVGDTFRLLTERRVGPNGIVRMGNIIAASMKLSGTLIQAVRFKSEKVRGDFFDQNGKSMRTGFLRAPLDFRRISSGYGMRRHPILGTMRKHQGTDYAADAGTTVRAIGDGVVIRAGWNNGYGNLVEIRHPNGFVSRYGHMRRFVVHGGGHVTQGQKIGEVGSTGLSTAPHLHFEVLVNGASRDPRRALANASSDPIPAAERVAFSAVRTQALALLDSPRMLATAESVSVRQAGSKAQ